MQPCLYCAHHNRAGSLLCENCGNAILDNDTLMRSTKTVPLPANDVWTGEGTTQIESHQSVLLHVHEAQSPILIKPTHRALIIGRAATTSELKVAIDLTAYGAYERGVSRIHAMMKRENGTLTIEDMGSANGTYVNGHTLIPGQRFLLRHGDEVRLGQLVTQIYFQ
jgi:hypothetical protein